MALSWWLVCAAAAAAFHLRAAADRRAMPNRCQASRAPRAALLVILLLFGPAAERAGDAVTQHGSDINQVPAETMEEMAQKASAAAAARPSPARAHLINRIRNLY